jgi:hypothetical protein
MEDKKRIRFGSDAEILERVRRFFSKEFMIGSKNAISKSELFSTIYETDPRELDVFTREYWGKQLSRAIATCRRDEDPFIVIKDGKYFMAETKDDTTQYKDRCNRNIENSKKAIKRADDWVEEKKFRKYKK